MPDNREQLYDLIRRFNRIGSALPDDFDPHDEHQRANVKMLLAEMKKVEKQIKEFKPCP